MCQQLTPALQRMHILQAAAVAAEAELDETDADPSHWDAAVQAEIGRLQGGDTYADLKVLGFTVACMGRKEYDDSPAWLQHLVDRFFELKKCD
jgi:hypothetical protein